MSVEPDEVEGLAQEIQRLIESNKKFLERIADEDFDAEPEESEPETGEELEDFEEL